MNIKLVKSKLKDSKFLYDLRNSFEIRNTSINKKKISFIQHKKWFLLFKKNKNNNIYIISYNLKKAGYIRIEKTDSTYLLSIALKKNFIGMGIGKKTLLEFEKKTKITNFTAYVLKNNTKSLYFFFSCNYYIDQEKKNIFIMKKKIKKNDFSKIINEIEGVRKKNNTNWMDILRVAFKFSPNETAKIMSKIYQEDSKISKLSKKLKNKL
jgi:ribosomal protein S18 acetylase RimI-like enzyme|tara:strand:+ start:32 stop:658 length:627 start_codon:yes stop_codon:yes gene_type:complete